MSSRLDLATVKRVLAIVIAIVIVIAAGILVGQAPAIFGVDEDPTAEITFEDQDGDGDSVEIDSVTLSEGGFVVITDGDEETLVVSEYLGSGTHENVTIEHEDGPELVGQLTATVHQDTTDDETYVHDETDGEEDQPYLDDGFPVSDTAAVTANGEDPLDDSFVVESIDAPSTATTSELITVTAEVQNPTELTTQQTVELRLDGEVVEQQVLELDAEESREVSFEVDTTGTEPGDRIVGVYAEADGALETIDFEFHTEPTVTVTDATTENATVDAAIPEPGFVAIEDNETTIGTSDQLDPGEHSNVSVAFDTDVDEDDDLTATLYAGDPDEIDDATPIDGDDEPIQTSFTIADVAVEESDEEAD